MFWRKNFWFRNCIFLSSPLFFNHFLKDKFWIEELYFSICGNILELGGLLLKSFDKIRVLLFYSQTELVIYVFIVFTGIIRGTLDKHIPEGLPRRFFYKIQVLIFAHQNKVRSLFFEFWETVEGINRARYLCFWSFIRILGGPFITVFLRAMVVRKVFFSYFQKLVFLELVFF